MKDIEFVNIMGPDHECDSIQSEKEELFNWLKADLENMEWAHLTPSVISDRLFLRALDHYSEDHIRKVGFPKPGIL